MKVLFFALILVNFGHCAVLLGSSGDKFGKPQARKLIVYPGFNEIQATSSYKNELKKIIKRVRSLKKNLESFQQETIRDVGTVVQKLEGQKDKNELDSVLNKSFLESQAQISGDLKKE